MRRIARNDTRARPGPEESIAARAERRLRGNVYLALKKISCEYGGGVLTLRGRLPSFYLKQMAQEAVSDTVGVERIDNQIEVCNARPAKAT
jgi:osmotically-inducible protein OsmY